MRRSGGDTVWKSFSDLAMGLMAVFVLVLVLLLWKQDTLTQQLAVEKEATQREKDRTEEQLRSVERERAALAEERGAFAIELIELLESTYQVVQAQDGAETWLTALFEEGPCQLRMTPRGELVIATGDGQVEAASLYESGQFVMSPAGRGALASCRDNLLKLAYCLSPVKDVPDAALARRQRYCEELPGDGERLSAVGELRIGVEALALEGSTDRIPLGGGTPSIRAGGASVPLSATSAASFVENAYLGAERARQALGNLIDMVEDADADDWDALQVMMSRLRIESPSYGRYQAGPPAWREPGCEGQPGSCAAARNLSLRIRWKKQALRAPFEAMRTQLCAQLGDPKSSFAKGLTSEGRDLAAERQRYRCGAVGAEEQAP